MIDSEVLQGIADCIDLAPLHNPHNIRGVEACKKNLPEVPQCGVFDTAFHQTMPEKAFLYALPLKFYIKHKIRRYGFHGTSHKYVSQLAADYLKKDIKKLKIITCHIGNGASITAVEGGKSIDTSALSVIGCFIASLQATPPAARWSLHNPRRPAKT